MGMKKTALYLAGLSLAVGGPASLLSTTDVLTGKKNATPAAVAPAQQQPGMPNAATPLLNAQPVGLSGTPSTEATPMPSLAEVLRFDMTVEGILRQWPRVTTGLPYMQLQGYRVPLVTGPALTDVAGALTYYFNARQQVQRITLRGTTGDPSMLVTLLTTRHQFTRRLTNDPGVVLYEVVDSGNQPAGSLKIQSAKVVTAAQPHVRFQVDLMMDRVE
jgi:hypothetical protein